MNLDFHDKFRSIIKKMEVAGNDYAEKKGQSWVSQELKHTVLSKLMQTYGPQTPTSKAEMLARGSAEYEKYLSETGQAITKELRAKAEYEKWKSSFEALRSLSSLEKHTQNLIDDK